MNPTRDQLVLNRIFDHINLIIFVTEKGSGRFFYGRESDRHIENFNDYDGYYRKVIERIVQETGNTDKELFEWDLYMESQGKWYSVVTTKTKWLQGEDAFLHMLMDVSGQKHIFERLSVEMTKDAMTGIYNHSYAFEMVAQMMKANNMFSVCFLDLDGLKDVNDSFGHSAGDDFIMKFVEIIKGIIRNGDIFCRMGGDEFLLIVPNSDQAATGRIVDRIIAGVDKFNLEGIYPFTISFSYGTECYDARIHATPKDLIDSADQRMYIQKRAKKAMLAKKQANFP